MGVEVCSRGPRYSTRFRARAVELYRLVQRGAISWKDLFNTLIDEFPEEFYALGGNISEETLRIWARRFPDLLELAQGFRPLQEP